MRGGGAGGWGWEGDIRNGEDEGREDIRKEMTGEGKHIRKNEEDEN